MGPMLLVCLNTDIYKVEVKDTKFPLVVIPNAAMEEANVASPYIHVSRRHAQTKVASMVHSRVADLLSWSLKWASKGLWPERGFENEVLDPKSLRGRMAGKELSLGWRPGSDLFLNRVLGNTALDMSSQVGVFWYEI